MNNTALLEALKRVHEEATKHRKGEKAANWFITCSGICDNVWAAGYRQGGFYPTILPIFKGWRSFSGDFYYPVPTLGRWASPRRAFYLAGDLWIDDYGDYRMDLLNHCIKTLELSL